MSQRIAESSKPRAELTLSYHDRLTSYCAEDVQTLWEESIEADSSFHDPFMAASDNDYQERFCNSVRNIVS